MKKPVFEMRQIADLKNWEDNPRSILEEDFNRLKEQVKKHGVYKTLLVNQDNIVLGGNMRLRAFKDLGITEAMCGIVQTDNPSEMLEYALSDNDQAGITDDLKLAEVFHLHPIDTKLYKIQSNTLRPLENIINPPDPIGGEDGQDQSGMDDSLSTYMNGNIKQIVLYYDNPAYEEMLKMLEVAARELGLESHTEIITSITRAWYEGNSAKKEVS